MVEPFTDEVVDRLFRTARSYNGFLDRPVAEDQLRAIWDIMKWGPTSANQMPARIVWCVSQEAKEKLAPLTSDVNAKKIREAPVSAIIAMDLDFPEHLPRLFPHTDARSWFLGNEALIETSAFRNSTLQGAYFILAARMVGLDTGPMSGFDNGKVDEAFFAGTKVRSNFISTLGYGDPATIYDRLPRPDFDEYSTIL